MGRESNGNVRTARRPLERRHTINIPPPKPGRRPRIARPGACVIIWSVVRRNNKPPLPPPPPRRARVYRIPPPPPPPGAGTGRVPVIPPQPGGGGGVRISGRTERQRCRVNDGRYSVHGGNQGNAIGHAAATAVHTRNSHRTHTRTLYTRAYNRRQSLIAGLFFFPLRVCIPIARARACPPPSPREHFPKKLLLGIVNGVFTSETCLALAQCPRFV